VEQSLATAAAEQLDSIAADSGLPTAPAFAGENVYCPDDSGSGGLPEIRRLYPAAEPGRASSLVLAELASAGWVEVDDQERSEGESVAVTGVVDDHRVTVLVSPSSPDADESGVWLIATFPQVRCS
jgi:hypothetical protein